MDKLKELLAKLNEKGLPIPLFRDHGDASVSLTLTLLSFLNCIYVILKPGNSDSMMYSLGLFGFCAGGYFNKKYQMRKIGGVLDVGEDLPVPSEEKEEK